MDEKKRRSEEKLVNYRGGKHYFEMSHLINKAGTALMELVFSVHANAILSPILLGNWIFSKRKGSKMMSFVQYLCQLMGLSSSTSCNVTVKSLEPEQMQLLGYCRNMPADHSVCVCSTPVHTQPVPTSNHPDELCCSSASSPFKSKRWRGPDSSSLTPKLDQTNLKRVSRGSHKWTCVEVVVRGGEIATGNIWLGK